MEIEGNYKIGILTHYYGSKNYGGLLQSYALSVYLNNIGYQCEVISYDFLQKSLRKKLTFKKICHMVKDLVKTSIYISYNIKKKKRDTCFSKFANSKIPHSYNVYLTKDLKSCVNDYDVFIVGSDQVWNPEYFFDGFYMDFVPSTKIKISYAASISSDNLTEEQLCIFKNSLVDFAAVSVREQNAVALLSPVSPVPVQWVLDPTMLLTLEDWDKICSPRIIEHPYMFCYFLGDDNTERQLAIEYSHKHNLAIVTLPHLLGYFRSCDKKFGHEQLYNVSPEDFISLIKYAEFIFTDSFHATVFSGIYQKQYIVFERTAKSSMKSRIYSLTSLYETPERFCNSADKQTISYIDSLPPIDYTRKLEKLEQMKEASKTFLHSNLSRLNKIT